MELIYVWIDSFKNIRKSSYLLNKRFSVKILDLENEDSSTKKIEIKVNDEDNCIFGENINNINVIIGKNCAGKTSFLECLAQEYHKNYSGERIEGETKFLLIYYDNYSEKYLFESVGVKFLFNGRVFGDESLGNYVVKYDEDKGEYRLFSNTEYGIGKGCVEDRTYYIHVKNTLNQLPRYDDYTKLLNRKTVNLNDADISKQLEYILDRKNDEGVKNNYVKLCIQANYKEGVYFGWRYYEYFPITRYYFEPLKYMTYSGNGETAGKNTRKSLFILSVLEAFLGRRCRAEDMEKVSAEIEEYVKVNKLLEIKEMGYSYIEDEVLNKLICKIAELSSTSKTDKIWEFIRTLNSVVKDIPKEYFFWVDTIEFNINDVERNIRIIQGLRKIASMYDIQRLEPNDFSKIINFNFMGLSDGLSYKVKLYATIESIISRDTVSTYNNIILLLDEPELYMHPEWARRFIYELISLFHDKYTNLKFQIIITTHSPFLLSDLPAENIAILEKNTETGLSNINDDVKGRTFASNIESLLRSNFFLDSTMGEFARQKLNYIIKQLNDDTCYDDEQMCSMDRIIQSIGEPYIQTKLKEMFHEKFALYNRLQEIDKEIERLKKEKKSIIEGNNK